MYQGRTKNRKGKESEIQAQNWAAGRPPVDCRSTGGWTNGRLPVDCRSTGQSAWAPGLAGRLPVDWSTTKSLSRSSGSRLPVDRQLKTVHAVHIGRVIGRLPVDRSSGICCY